MRRRWVAALILATAIVFSAGGTALGYWVIPDSKGPTAECISARHFLNTDDYDQTVADYYNAHCR